MKNSIKRSVTILLLFTLLTGVKVFAATTDSYVVQPGDTLWEIAQKYKVGISEIISANPQLSNPNEIYPGDKVVIPLQDPQTTSLEEQVVKLVNEERAKAGLKPLTINWEASRVARYKSEDMKNNNYFSHTSPTYGSPFDMLKKFNVNYTAAGENIARGQKTAEAVMKAWMNSEGHRKNILSDKFTEIGVGYADGSSPYWTQIFLRP